MIELFMLLSSFITNKKYNKRYFALSMEIKKVKALEKIDEIFRVFKIEIRNKSLTRKDRVILDINYKATPLRHHLVMKRLLKLKGVGKFYKI